MKHHAVSDVAPLPPQANGGNASAPYVWYVILLLTLVNVFSYVDRMALAVLAPLIKADLVLSDMQLGLLSGFAFALFYAICGVPIGWWADRGVRRNIIALAVAAWSAAMALGGAAQNFWQLFAARVGIGAGEAGGVSPGASIICDYVPLDRRAGVFAIHTFGLYAGLMIGMGLGGWLGESIGWRWTFVALGLPGLALALIVRLTLREPTRGFFDVREPSASSLTLAETLMALWGCRTYRMIVLFHVLSGFVQYGLNQWWPSLYVRVSGLSLASLGIYLGLAIGIGSGLGLLCGGVLANKAARRDVRWPLMIGAVATVFATPVAWATAFVGSAFASIMLVCLTALLWCVAYGPVIAIEASVVGARMRATALSIHVFLGSIVGVGLGPFCVGLLSDLLAPALGTDALRYAMLLPISFLPLMALALYAAARALPGDLEAAGIVAETSAAPAVSRA